VSTYEKAPAVWSAKSLNIWCRHQESNSGPTDYKLFAAKSECLLFPKAVISLGRIGLFLRSAFGRGCVKTRRISWLMGQRSTLTARALQMRFRLPISISEKLESSYNLPPALFILRFHTASARSGRLRIWIALITSVESASNITQATDRRLSTYSSRKCGRRY